MLLALVLSLTLNLLLGGLTLFYFKSLEKKDRRNERERLAHVAVEREFLDRIMHLSGKTWVVPPRELPKEEEELLDEETQMMLAGWRDA